MVYDPDHGTVDSPLRPDQVVVLPGAADALRQINRLGLLAIVVSNQPVVAKGKTSQALLSETTATLRRELARGGARLDAIYYCLHHPDAVIADYRSRCACRKPEPGLLTQAAADLDVDLAASFMIGDGLTDVEAGAAAGCRTIWLGQDRCDWCTASLGRAARRPDFVVPDLVTAAHAIATTMAAGQAAWKERS